MFKLIAISDVHNKYDKIKIPEGDLLIVAGDLSNDGTIRELIEFNNWLADVPVKHKVVIAGNHDFELERCYKRRKNKYGAADNYLTQYQSAEQLISSAHYLCDSEITIEGFRIYGSPWQPRFYDWAFNLDRGQEIQKKWDLIPAGIDILVTHGPPFGHGDMTQDGNKIGCVNLFQTIRKIKPKYHIFGHNHGGYGVTYEGANSVETTFINASICDIKYRPVNEPLVFEIDN